MRCTRRFGESPHRISDIKHEDLGVGIAPKLGCDHCEQNGLSRSSSSQDERVSDIRVVQVEAERRCTVGCRPHERRALWRKEGARIVGQSRPHTRHWKEIGDVPCGNERAPEIWISVPRKASQIGVERIDRLDTAGEARVVERLQDLARDVAGANWIRVHYDHDLRVEAEPDGAARVFRCGFSRVNRHRSCVLVEPEVVVRFGRRRVGLTHHLLHPGTRTFPLFEPLELLTPNVFRRFVCAERDQTV